jgi:hypothetical protein
MSNSPAFSTGGEDFNVKPVTFTVKKVLNFIRRFKTIDFLNCQVHGLPPGIIMYQIYTQATKKGNIFLPILNQI